MNGDVNWRVNRDTTFGAYKVEQLQLNDTIDSLLDSRSAHQVQSPRYSGSDRPQKGTVSEALGSLEGIMI